MFEIAPNNIETKQKTWVTLVLGTQHRSELPQSLQESCVWSTGQQMHVKHMGTRL